MRVFVGKDGTATVNRESDSPDINSSKVTELIEATALKLLEQHPGLRWTDLRKRIEESDPGFLFESVRYDLRMETHDLKHLERCVELATQALEAGDEPFGSVLVDSVGRVCFEDHNRVASGDRTRHPEFALARWAAANMSPAERAASTVYTSGEHCPMCAAAHGWVGLGRIVYASSSAQLATWLDELGVPPPPVATLPIKEVVPGATVEGPVDELATRLRDLHFRFHTGNGSAVAPSSNA